jgi:hypothetical protein
MSKFKIGDKVRCIVPFYDGSGIFGLIKNKTYRVADVSFDRFKVVGIEWNWFQYRFEKVKSNGSNVR